MENSDQESLVNAAVPETENVPNPDQELTSRREPFYLWKVLSASIHSVVQTLIGVNVGVTLWFAFKSTPVSAFQMHVGLSVIGYQFLIAHGILCLQSVGWSALSLRHRRRVHWVLQLTGSMLAITGSAIMFKEKNDSGRSHFSSVHGKLALAALVFTCASLVNGLLSLYVVEVRRWVSGRVSKFSHILFGSAAFCTSSACLALGFNKKSFVEWASQDFAYVMVGIVSVYTSFIVILPLSNILRRFLDWQKIKIC